MHITLTSIQSVFNMKTLTAPTLCLAEDIQPVLCCEKPADGGAGTISLQLRRDRELITSKAYGPHHR